MCIPRSQYHGSWCPGEGRIQGISSHGIGLVFLEYSSFSTTRVNIHVLQYIPRNMHMGFALLCFVVVIHWLIFPYPSGLLHWHCGNLMIAPVPAKQPWWIWINTSCEFIMNDCITTTKQSTTKPCAYFLGYTVHNIMIISMSSNESEIQNYWLPYGSLGPMHPGPRLNIKTVFPKYGDSHVKETVLSLT